MPPRHPHLCFPYLVLVVVPCILSFESESAYLNGKYYLWAWPYLPLFWFDPINLTSPLPPIWFALLTLTLLLTYKTYFTVTQSILPHLKEVAHLFHYTYPCLKYLFLCFHSELHTQVFSMASVSIPLLSLGLTWLYIILQLFVFWVLVSGSTQVP